VSAMITYCRYERNHKLMANMYKDEIPTSIEIRGKGVSIVVLIRISGCTKDKSTLN